MINYKNLKKAWDILDSGCYETNGVQVNGTLNFVQVGKWSIALGGYDTGYQICYEDKDVLSVNFNYQEVRIDNDFGYRKFINMILKTIDCQNFEIIEEE